MQNLKKLISEILKFKDHIRGRLLKATYSLQNREHVDTCFAWIMNQWASIETDRCLIGFVCVFKAAGHCFIMQSPNETCQLHLQSWYRYKDFIWTKKNSSTTIMDRFVYCYLLFWISCLMKSFEDLQFIYSLMS